MDHQLFVDYHITSSIFYATGCFALLALLVAAFQMLSRNEQNGVIHICKSTVRSPIAYISLGILFFMSGAIIVFLINWHFSELLWDADLQYRDLVQSKIMEQGAEGFAITFDPIYLQYKRTLEMTGDGLTSLLSVISAALGSIALGKGILSERDNIFHTKRTAFTPSRRKFMKRKGPRSSND